MNVSTGGFANIFSFQHTLSWDPSLLTNASVQQFGIGDLTANNFNTTTAGQLAVGWDDSTLQGVSLENNQTLYQICFDATATANGSALIEFRETPLAVEVVDGSGNTMRPELFSGLVLLDCANGGNTDGNTGGGNTGGDGNTGGPLSMGISTGTGTCLSLIHI